MINGTFQTSLFCLVIDTPWLPGGWMLYTVSVTGITYCRCLESIDDGQFQLINLTFADRAAFSDKLGSIHSPRYLNFFFRSIYLVLVVSLLAALMLVKYSLVWLWQLIWISAISRDSAISVLPLFLLSDIHNANITRVLLHLTLHFLVFRTTVFQ